MFGSKSLFTCLVLAVASASASLRGATHRRMAEITAIDFSGFSKGESLSDLGNGVSVKAFKRQGSESGPFVPATAMIFDTSSPSGEDEDLGTPNKDFGGPGEGVAGKKGSATENSVFQGNVVIISEDDDASDPDDHEHGGTLLFTFENPVDLKKIGLLDNEEGTIFTASLASGKKVQTILGQGGDNSYESVDFEGSTLVGVVQLNITMGGSGAITHLYLEEFVPEIIIEPTAAPTECACTITGFIYWNQDGVKLADGAVLCHLDHSVNVEAVTKDCMGNVILNLDGEVSIVNTASASPYMVSGDAMEFPIGEYTLEAYPDNDHGLKETISFSVVECLIDPVEEPTEPPAEEQGPTEPPAGEQEEPTEKPNDDERTPTAAPTTPVENIIPGLDGDGRIGTKTGQGGGDPHFKTWSGIKFDYHGECDLLLIHNPEFSNGLGLRLYIRTIRIGYYSYVERTALQIGSDVLEFANDVDNYLLNGVVPMEKKVTMAGFEVRTYRRAVSVRLDNSAKAKIDFYHKDNGMPYFNVDAGGTNIFEGSHGLLGDWETGRFIARDGVTEVADPESHALEWQVRDTEPILFQSIRAPQYPAVCIPPSKMLGKRLGDTRVRAAAEKVCVTKGGDVENCIFDVMATRSFDAAEEVTDVEATK